MLRYLFFTALFWTTTLGAQNLITNPGLEDVDTSYHLPYSGDPFDIDNIIGWWQPGGGSTDYFNSDGKHPETGSNYFNKEMKAHSGNGYAGIYIENGSWREYIGISLNDTLEAGKNYKFTIWLAISRRSNFAMQNLQLEFWDQNFVYVINENTKYPRANPKYPAVELKSTNLVSSVSNWTKLSVEFTAVGGETCLVFGYMYDYARFTSLPVTRWNRGSVPYVYYYIDDLELVPIGGPAIPRNTVSRPIIYFDTDKDVIQAKFYAPLDSVVSAMKQNPAMKITINGYTDSVGNVEDNLDLSRRRAEAVKKYLVDRGIAESRMTTAWYAESRPAGEENAMNRRVEFIYIRP